MSDDVKVWEMLDSMSGSVSNSFEQGEVRTVRRRYLIGQTAGFNDTVYRIKEYAPPYVNSDGAGIYWMRKNLDVAGVGNRYFDCTATYETLIPKEQSGGTEQDYVPGSIAWDTSGHTEHITQAISERQYGDGAVNFEKAINVSGDSVNGIDVVRPGMRYSETWILPIQVAMDYGYIGGVHRLTGTVNASAFRCFDPGECLFMGARGQWQGDQPYVAVTYDFEAKPNTVVDLSGTSDELRGTLFKKEGWEYMWFLYSTAVKEDSLIQRPIAVYVDKIYEKEDWGALGIVAHAPAAPRQPVGPVPPLADFGWNNNQ